MESWLGDTKEDLEVLHPEPQWEKQTKKEEGLMGLSGIENTLGESDLVQEGLLPLPAGVENSYWLQYGHALYTHP